MSINVIKEAIKRDQGWCKGQQFSFAGGDDGGYLLTILTTSVQSVRKLDQYLIKKQYHLIMALKSLSETEYNNNPTNMKQSIVHLQILENGFCIR
jgi:hypothetical protein